MGGSDESVDGMPASRFHCSEAQVLYEIQDFAKSPRCNTHNAVFYACWYTELSGMFPSLIPSVLPVRSGTIRRCPSTPCTRCSAVNIGSRVSLIDPILPALWHTIWALSSKAIRVRLAGSRVIACKFLQDGGEVLLQDFDALLYDHVRVQVAHRFEFEEELRGSGVVVERFAVLGRFFPFSVLRFWPARLKCQ